MANMVAAFFGKAADAPALFEKLDIASDPSFSQHCGRYNVLYIDFSEVPRDCSDYAGYIARIQDGIIADLREAYPDLEIPANGAIWDVLNDIFQRKGDTFVFVMDEWDAVFHMPFIGQKDKETFLLFRKSMLKGQACVKLAYMTGILPIAKYSGGSELNMFLEYDMSTRARFGEYFGFLDEEVDRLYEIYRSGQRRPASPEMIFLSGMTDIIRRQDIECIIRDRSYVP